MKKRVFARLFPHLLGSWWLASFPFVRIGVLARPETSALLNHFAMRAGSEKTSLEAAVNFEIAELTD